MSGWAAGREAQSTKANPGGLDLVVFSNIFFHHRLRSLPPPQTRRDSARPERQGTEGLASPLPRPGRPTETAAVGVSSEAIFRSPASPVAPQHPLLAARPRRSSGGHERVGSGERGTEDPGAEGQHPSHSPPTASDQRRGKARRRVGHTSAGSHPAAPAAATAERTSSREILKILLQHAPHV